ncbi:MAG: hypothetical protein JSR47_14840 [Proteobacteria bacterium]|nr:hypothetical protein [Pseudomonadota bacterium]
MAPGFYPSLHKVQSPDGGLSLRGYMLLLIAAIMLPMLILVAIVAWDYGKAAQRTIEAQRLDVANNIKYMIDREIDKTVGFLDGISNARGLRQNTPDVVERLMAMARSRGFEALVVYDATGKLAFSPQAAEETVPADLLGFTQIMAGNKAFVSNLIPSAGPKPGLFFVSVPILENGKIVAMLSGGMPPQRLQRLFAESGLRDSWSAGIVDREGVLLARSRLPERYVGMAAQQPMAEAARGDKMAGLFAVIDRDGVLVKNSFERSRLSGWTSGVAVPAAIVDAPLWHTALTMTLIGIVFCLVSLILAMLVASYLSRAIQRLGIAAVAIASGDVVRMPASNITELQDVSRSIEVTGAVNRRFDSQRRR